MAASETDPFGAAKTNLRDTVKWLATVFSALAAAALGGASFVGLSGAHGGVLVGALAGGAVGLVCLFVATGLTLRLLTAESFHITELNKHPTLTEHLNRYAIDILPPEYATVQDFVAERDQAITTLRAHASNRDDPNYLNAQKYLQAINEPLARLVSLAHFEWMRLRFDDTIPILFLLALGALGGLGTYAVCVGAAKDTKATAASAGPLVSVALPHVDPAMVEVYAHACGTTDSVEGEIIGQPRKDWLTVRLISPRECAGIVFSAPAKVVTMAKTAEPASGVDMRGTEARSMPQTHNNAEGEATEKTSAATPKR